jgi:phosphoribosyl 1,2-cyclic phosphodiesterase
MKLKVIGSSSSGNGYVFETEGEVLIIETGCKFSDVKKAIGFKVGKIVGALVTHSHNDHSGRVGEYLKEGVKVCAAPETINETGIVHHNFIPVNERASFSVGLFKVLPFRVVHDVVCHGYLIDHPECGKFVFITDTHYSPARFRGLNQIVIEANYSSAIIEEKIWHGSIDKSYYDRVLRSHMSLETTIDFLNSNDLSSVNNIVLIHLSTGNSDAKLFKETIESLTGKTTHVADSGIEIGFNKSPF